MPATTISPVFTSDDFDVPHYDMPTVANHLDTGNLHDYWSHDIDNIAVNAVVVDNNNPNVIHG